MRSFARRLHCRAPAATAATPRRAAAVASHAGLRWADAGHAGPLRQPGGAARFTLPRHPRQFATAVRARPLSSAARDEGEEAGDERQVEATDLRVLRSLGLHPDQTVAGPGYNRYMLLPAAALNQASLGSIFAWSVFSKPLMRDLGVVVPAPLDFTLAQSSTTFSLVVGGFVWGAVFGTFHDRWGPRACCLLGATMIGGGFGLASLAIQNHNLPLLYAGGLVWGISMGWAYVPPLANVIRWFPERKGFASSMVVVGYGAGALIAAPIFFGLLRHFQKAPEYLGSSDVVGLINRDGRLFAAGAEVGSAEVEVVVATATDVWSAGFPGLAEGQCDDSTHPGHSDPGHTRGACVPPPATVTPGSIGCVQGSTSSGVARPAPLKPSRSSG